MHITMIHLLQNRVFNIESVFDLIQSREFGESAVIPINIDQFGCEYDEFSEKTTNIR